MTATADSRDDIRARIVEAATRLLHEQGAAAVTIRAVARDAGVQAPTLYRLFDDKEGLLGAVAEHVMASYVASTADTAARSHGDPVADLRAAWHEHVAFGLANPDLYAMLVLPGAAERSPAAAAGVEVLRARIRRVAAAGLLRVDEHRAAEVIHAAGTGTVLTLLGASAEDRDPTLADAMFESVAGAVLRETPATDDATARGVVVTFATVLPELPGLTDAERVLMGEWVDRSLTALRDDAAS